MSTDAEILLAEYSIQHGSDKHFLAAVRPMAELIVHPATPRQHRRQFREMLSQSCAHDSSIRRKCQEAQETLNLSFDELGDLLGSIRRSVT